MRRLEVSGVRTAFVDLTKIGGRNVTPEQWYAGIAVEIGRSLELKSEILGYWKENGHLSPVQRLFGSLREVVLDRLSVSVAIFFDEIDATRSLAFSADEFFAAIRECFNRRVQDPELQRLTFCLLGVAVPSDLINNPTSTPFNIGERIYLKDFTLEEAMPLAEGFSNQPPANGNRQLLERVFYWTNGHPYLTQTLCLAIAAEQNIGGPDAIDAMVMRDLFEPKARDTNINLADVGNRALHAGDLEADPEKFRADLLSAYERALGGKPLPDDESNRVASLLKLSGLMRPEGNNLVVRNRIYRQVFDRRWVRENMPGQELLRQRRSYWLGVVRTAVIGGLVIALVSILAVHDRFLAAENGRLLNIALKDRAEAQRLEKIAEYRAYVSDINAMRTADVDKNYIKLAKLLEGTKDSPFRGIEWQYWNAQIHDVRTEIAFPPNPGSMEIAPDGKSVAIIDSATRAGEIYSYPELNELRQVPTVPSSEEFGYLFGRWISAAVLSVHEFRLIDVFSGEPLGTVTFPTGGVLGLSFAPDRSALGIVRGNPGQHRTEMISIWLPSPLRRAFDYPVPRGIYFGAISSGGRFAILALRPPASNPSLPASRLQEFLVVDILAKREVDRFSVNGGTCGSVAISNDGRFVAAAFLRGRAIARDVRARKTVLDAKPFATAVSKPVISDDDRRLLIQGDQTVQVYDLGSGRLICTQHGGSAFALAPDGKTFAVVGPGCRVCDVKPAQTATRHLADGANFVLGVDKEDRPILEHDGVTQLVDPTTLAPVDHSAALDPKTGDQFVGCDAWRCVPEEGGIAVAQTTGARRLCLLQGVHVMPRSMDATADGSHIGAILAGTDLQVFDSNGSLRWTYHGGKAILMFCAWAPDGSRIVVAGWDERLVVLDGQTGHVLRSIASTDDSRASSFAFSNHGHRLAWGTDLSIHVLDLDANKAEILLTDHSGRINTLAFSPDDSRLLSTAADGTLRLWDPGSGAQMLRLGSGRGSVLSAVFDKEARRIFATDESGDLTVYRLGPGS